MSGFRRAAVELHGLTEEDQQWILAALPASDQVSLNAYLVELKNLGFSSDSFLLPTRIPTANVNSPSIIDARFGQIQSASSSTMFAVLNGESCSFIAQVLSIYHWVWTNEFLLKLSQPRQSLVRSMLSTTMETLSVRQKSILKHVNERLRLQKSESASTAKIHKKSNTDVFTKVFHLIKQWKP